jgi:hypothetical protein
MSKGSKNRTSNYKKYFESSYWDSVDAKKKVKRGITNGKKANS